MLAVSNLWVIYSIYRVLVSATLNIMWKYTLNTVLVAQAVASAAQHITEWQCSPHHMCGVVCSDRCERTLLWTDRGMAGVVSVAWIALIWSHVGIILFIESWYVIYLVWCLGLIHISDNHISGSPLLYTAIHLIWHISIYSFLGDIIWWIDVRK